MQPHSYRDQSGLIGDAISMMLMLVGNALELSSLGMLPRPAESIPFKEMINEAREHFKNAALRAIS